MAKGCVWCVLLTTHSSNRLRFFMRLVALQYSLLLFVCLFPSSRRVYVRMSLLVSLLISLSASDLKRWPSARVLHSQFQHFIYRYISLYILCKCIEDITHVQWPLWLLVLCRCSLVAMHRLCNFILILWSATTVTTTTTTKTNGKQTNAYFCWPLPSLYLFCDLP